MNENTHKNDPVIPSGNPVTFEQIMQMLERSGLNLAEQSRETKRILAEQSREAERIMAERTKETEKILNEKLRETWEFIKESDRKIAQLRSEFSDDWGELVESLVKGDLIRLLTEKGIRVKKNLENYSGCVDGNNFEFDIIAIDEVEIVIVEVKTTLRVKDVKHFLSKLQKAKYFMPEYSSMKIYGAVAYLKAHAASEIMAQNQGLFVIRATGNSASIINEPDFRPRAF